MADYDITLQDFNTGDTETTQTDPNLTNLDAIPVSSLSMEDIKNYIDYLARNAGVMSSTELQEEIQKTITNLGIVSKADLLDLANNILREVGAMPASDIKDFITNEVQIKINELNQNLDYVNDVKDYLNKKIDRLQQEVQNLEGETEKTIASISDVREELNLKIKNIEAAFNALEKMVNVLVENREVYDALEKEALLRAESDEQLTSLIQNVSNNVEKELSALKLDFEKFKSEYQSSIDTINLELNQKIDAVKTLINSVQLEAENNKNILNTLLLNTTDLQEKFNLIKDFDTDGQIRTSVESLQILLDSINQKIANIEAISQDIEAFKVDTNTALDSKYQEMIILVEQEKTLRSNDFENLKNSINHEISERTAQYKILSERIQENRIELEKEIQIVQDNLTNLSSLLNSNYSELKRDIDEERKDRIEQDVSLKNIINDKEREIYDLISTVDTRDDVSVLRINQVELKKYIDTVKAEIEKHMIDFRVISDKLDSNYTALENLIKTYTSNEKIEREQADEALKMELVTKIDKNTSDISAINSKIDQMDETLADLASCCSGDVCKEAAEVAANVGSAGGAVVLQTLPAPSLQWFGKIVWQISSSSAYICVADVENPVSDSRCYWVEL